MIEKQCTRCKQILPLTSFDKTDGWYRNVCKECRKLARKQTTYKDIKGNVYKSVDISVSEEELKDYLYNKDKEISYTVDDLVEEVVINGENMIASIQTTLKIHNDIFIKNQKAVMESIKSLSDKLLQLVEVKDGTIQNGV